MVVVAQLVRVAVCGAAGRRFEPGQPPRISKAPSFLGAFLFYGCRLSVLGFLFLKYTKNCFIEID